VAMADNVSTAHAIVLSTLPPPGPRDTIVCTAADFPSVIYQLRAQQALGFRLRIVEAEEDFTVQESRVVDAIDERTALVAVSHVLFKSSYAIDPRPIVERAHAAGAPVVLDCYQSAGIIPVDVTALGVDFATGGCLKWLCGGPGNAFLFARPDRLAHVRPRVTGWFSHPQPFAFDIGEFDPPPDARRLLTGTPAIPAYYAALPGLKIIREIGIDRIRAWRHATRHACRALSPSMSRTPPESPAPSTHATSSSTTVLASASASRRTSTTLSTRSPPSWRRSRRLPICSPARSAPRASGVSTPRRQKADARSRRRGEPDAEPWRGVLLTFDTTRGTVVSTSDNSLCHPLDSTSSRARSTF
jgi:selenocysteine lyase/cysteine desulfurase